MKSSSESSINAPIKSLNIDDDGIDLNNPVNSFDGTFTLPLSTKSCIQISITIGVKDMKRISNVTHFQPKVPRMKKFVMRRTILGVKEMNDRTSKVGYEYWDEFFSGFNNKLIKV